MPLYDLSKIVKAGHGHRIRKLIIGNLCPICTSSDEDVVDYVEGFEYYFPDIFQQLVGLQSLDINYSSEYVSQRALGAAFIDTILEAFESRPPRLKALSITYNDDSDQPVTPCLGHERMSRIMPQIRYLRINLSLTRTDGIMLLQYPDEYVSSACQFVNDGRLSAFEFVKYGENLRGVELMGLSEVRDVSLSYFHPMAPLQHLVLAYMHVFAQDLLRLLRHYRQTLTIVTLTFIVLHDGTWKEIYEELDSLPSISQWTVAVCTPSLTAGQECEVRSGPGGEYKREKVSPSVFHWS
jgi:hypothetical protein